MPAEGISLETSIHDDRKVSRMELKTSRQRARWLKTLHQWHWVSSALCLVGMLLFALTGITLNHASQIEARPRVQTRQAALPEPLRAELKKRDGEDAGAPLPPAVQDWLRAQFGVHAQGREAEWSEEDIYLSLPRPGGDAWLRIDRATAEVEYERTDRGWIAYLNDLHKGRHTGLAWSWFIDIFAVACLVFCITGLLILKQHAPQRPMVWPVTGLGLVLPVLIALLFIH